MYIGPWQEYKLAKIASQTPSVETVEAYYAQWKELSQKIGTEEATKRIFSSPLFTAAQLSLLGQQSIRTGAKSSLSCGPRTPDTDIVSLSSAPTTRTERRTHSGRFKKPNKTRKNEMPRRESLGQSQSIQRVKKMQQVYMNHYSEQKTREKHEIEHSHKNELEESRSLHQAVVSHMDPNHEAQVHPVNTESISQYRSAPVHQNLTHSSLGEEEYRAAYESVLARVGLSVLNQPIQSESLALPQSRYKNSNNGSLALEHSHINQAHQENQTSHFSSHCPSISDPYFLPEIPSPTGETNEFNQFSRQATHTSHPHSVATTGSVISQLSKIRGEMQKCSPEPSSVNQSEKAMIKQTVELEDEIDDLINWTHQLDMADLDLV